MSCNCKNRCGFGEPIKLYALPDNPIICSSLYDPVMGQNGLIYPNECEAKKAGVELIQDFTVTKDIAQLPEPFMVPNKDWQNLVKSEQFQQSWTPDKWINIDGSTKINLPPGSLNAVLNVTTEPIGPMPAPPVAKQDNSLLVGIGLILGLTLMTD